MVEKKFQKGLSVVICTYNGAVRLIPTLEALKKQVGLENISWEVILVDNASKDSTQYVARSVWANYPVPLIILYESVPGRDSALKTGFKKVQYDYMINVDDDNWLSPEYLRTAFYIMENDRSIGILGGLGEGVYEEDLPEELKPFEAALALGEQNRDGSSGYLKNKDSVFGAGFVIRKTYYDELYDKGFRFFLTGRAGKDLGSGEDQEICIAMKLLGYNLYYSSDLKFKHAISKDRVTKEYFTKLYRAFGRSEFVLDIYRYYGNLHGGFWLPLSCEWYLTYLLRANILAAKFYFRYILASKNNTLKMKYFLELQRKKSLATYTFFNAGFFLTLKRNLKTATWIKRRN